VSELEQQLLDFWKADAREYRRRQNFFERTNGEDEEAEIFSAGKTTCTRRDMVTAKKSFAGKCAHVDCGRDFISRRVDKKYCSALCSKRAGAELDLKRQRDRRIAEGKKVHRLRVRGRMQISEISDRSALAADGSFYCLQCGHKFFPKKRPGKNPYRIGGSNSPRFCGPKCKWQARRHAPAPCAGNQPPDFAKG